jgi:hypothetical protein
MTERARGELRQRSVLPRSKSRILMVPVLGDERSGSFK